MKYTLDDENDNNMIEPIEDAPLMNPNEWAIWVSKSPGNTWPWLKIAQILDLRGTWLLWFISTIVFTWTTTTSWTAGSVYTWDWVTYTYLAGTASTAAISYVYIDLDVSSTVLQVTTTPATALGIRKIHLHTSTL